MESFRFHYRYCHVEYRNITTHLVHLKQQKVPCLNGTFYVLKIMLENPTPALTVFFLAVIAL